MLHRHFRRLVIASTALLSACGSETFDVSRTAAAIAFDPWANQSWVEKIAARLHLGNNSLSDDDVQRLAAEERAAVVDHLMSGYDYERTLLDFFDDYLNDKGALGIDAIIPPTQISDFMSLTVAYSAGNKPPELNAAIAVLKGEDAGVLFSTTQATYIPPLTATEAGTELSGAAHLASQDQLIDAAAAKIEAIQMTLAGRLDLPADATVPALNEACTAILTPDSDTTTEPQPSLVDQITEELNAMGMKPFSDTLTSSWYGKLESGCRMIAAGRATSLPEAKDTLTSAAAALPKTVAFAKANNIDNYSVASIVDLRAGGIDELLTGPIFSFSGFPYLRWDQLKNSSTNFNRRRAAYMLRTYFCDDLTPINVVTTDDHPQGRHASDPSCQSCHYKLDPMAGFFRERQFFGVPIQESPGTPTSLIFDDFKSISGDELTAYLDNWKAPQGDAHEWNVGYIRSTQNSAANFYGSTLDDLYGFMRQAPEVRQCLVKRLAEYFVGKNQVFDGGYLASLAARLEPATPNSPTAIPSGKAISGIIKSLLLSNTMAAPDPRPDECYDFAPGATPSTLPCQVAWIVQNNCATCHRGQGAAGGLDLTNWAVIPGVGETFVHLDDNGVQRTKQETFSRIKARLEATDPSERMPLGKDFSPPTDRAALYKWVDSVLSNLGEPSP